MKLIAVIVLSVICACTAAIEKSMEPGPCPDYPVMETFDNNKIKDTWTDFSVYATKFDDGPECQCGKVVHTRQADNTTFLQWTGTLSTSPNELIELNSTCTPVAGKPGVFDVVHEEKYDILGEFANATIKFYILDTDYDNYSVGLCCMETEKGHQTTATVNYKNINPPNVLLEKATRLFKALKFDITKIKAVKQTNCPTKV